MKRRIMDAAVEVIAEKGFQNTGVRDIIREAGVSIGSFYAYFERKEDVVREIVQEMGTALRDVLRGKYKELKEQYLSGKTEASRESLQMSFEALYGAIFQFIKKERKKFLITFREGLLVNPYISPVSRTLFQQLTDDIAKRLTFGIQVGAVLPMRPKEVAAVADAIFGLMIHSAQVHLESGAGDYRQRVKALVDFSVHGVWCSYPEIALRGRK